MIMDFPAPVSPERTLKPYSNSIVTDSINAIFFTVKLVIIFYLTAIVGCPTIPILPAALYKNEFANNRLNLRYVLTV